MSVKSGMPSMGAQPGIVAGIVKRAVQILLVFVVQGAILFLAVGRLNWEWAWVFLGIYIVSVAINSVFLLRTSPETVAERGQAKGGRDWDKIIGSLWGLFQFLLLPLAAALDTRFNWTREIGMTWHLMGALAFAAGLGLFGWAMITNTYFSTVVRIQSDRGQTVCRSGPYGYVRHPGYSGTILESLAIPFLLGSLWALIPGIAAAALMVIRTALEDRMLQSELPGYANYAKEVRYRLLPGLW